MTCTADRHGTASAYYNYGCRCDTARRARERQRKTARLRDDNQRVPALGSVRRLHALMRLGWTLDAVAARAGCKNRSSLTNVLYVKQVRLHTHRRIASIYDALSMELGPSARTRAHAERQGWPPPLAWDDDTIDDPKARPNRTGSAYRGDTARADHRETVWNVVTAMTRDGYPAAVIAARVGITERSVTRIRNRDRNSRQVAS